MLSFWYPGSNSVTCWMKACKSQIRESVTKHFPTSSIGKMGCASVVGLFEAIGITCNPSEWRLFIDSSSRSLKAVLPHNGNNYPSLPKAHSVHLKEDYTSVKMCILPMHVVNIRQCPSSPWFDKECRTLWRQARRHERKFRRTDLPGCNLCVICIVNIVRRNEHIGRIGSFPTPKNPSVCGPRSTPFLVVAGSSRNALREHRLSPLKIS